MQLLGGVADHNGFERRLQFRREHTEKLFRSKIFDFVVCSHDFLIVVLNWRGKIAGEDLGSVMIQRDRGTLIGVAGNPIYIAADHTQGMRDHSDHMAVFLNVFRKRIPHQAPSGNIAHPGNQGEKVVVHNILQSDDFDAVAGSLYHPARGTSTGEN